MFKKALRGLMESWTTLQCFTWLHRIMSGLRELMLLYIVFSLMKNVRCHLFDA